jgi:O-antigen/teichoic acid export membrane protein
LLRIQRSFGAGLLSFAMGALLQWIAVPCYLANWGVETFGLWVFAQSTASLLFLTDLGLASASANQMRALYAGGETRQINHTFESVFTALFFFSSVFVLGLAWFSQSPLIFILGLYCWAMQRTGALHDLFRAAGDLDRASIWNEAMRVTETLLMLGAVLFGKGMVFAAGLLLSARVCGFVAMWRDASRRYSWFRFRIWRVDWNLIQQLFRPGLSFFGVSLSEMLGAQTLNMGVGYFAGSSALAAFSATRTLANAGVPLVSLVRNVTVPELSAFYGAGHADQVRKLHWRLCKATFWWMVLVCALVGTLGPEIFHWWTGGRLVFEPAVFHLCLAFAFFSVGWQTLSAAHYSRNRIESLAIAKALTQLTGLALGLLCLASGRMVAALGIWVLVELVMVCVALWLVRSDLKH